MIKPKQAPGRKQRGISADGHLYSADGGLQDLGLFCVIN